MHPIKLDLDSLVVDTFATAHDDGADTTLQAAMLTGSCGDTFCRVTCEFICGGQIQAAAMITASCGETLCEIPCPAN